MGRQWRVVALVVTAACCGAACGDDDLDGGTRELLVEQFIAEFEGQGFTVDEDCVERAVNGLSKKEFDAMTKDPQSADSRILGLSLSGCLSKG